MKFYLVRVMSPQVHGPCFRNYVVSAMDIVSARDYAFRTFGTESVGSVEAVESLSLLPKDAEYISGR